MWYPTPLTFHSAGHLGDPFLTFLGYLAREPNIPQIIGMSYGMEQVPPPGYAMAVCNLFAQLGVRGASVLVASGINGVRRRWELRPVRPRIPCILYVWRFIAATQTQVQVAHKTTMFFAGPWVISVCSTTGINLEVAASFLRGGSSTYFPRPYYHFQKLGNDYEGLYIWARCRDLTFSYLLFCAGLGVVATPTSLRKRSGSQSS